MISHWSKTHSKIKTLFLPKQGGNEGLRTAKMNCILPTEKEQGLVSIAIEVNCGESWFARLKQDAFVLAGQIYLKLFCWVEDL